MATHYTKFDNAKKDQYTILVPGMLPIHFRLLKPTFEQSGYHLEVLSNESEQVKEEGLAHVHNDTCYPALLVIGQFIDALKSGKYDLNKVALVITQTAGGCRASNYLSLLRKALQMEAYTLSFGQFFRSGKRQWLKVYDADVVKGVILCLIWRCFDVAEKPGHAL